MSAARMLEGKKGIVLGVANKRSIAWGIASALAESGAAVAFTYQGEKLLRRVEGLVASRLKSLVVVVGAVGSVSSPSCPTGSETEPTASCTPCSGATA